MKKILFLIHDLGQGGAEKVLINLVNNMDKSKFDITVMSLFGGGVNEQFLDPSIKLITCFSKPIPGNSHLMKLFSPKQLHNWLIKDRYDIEVAYLEGPSARIISGCQDPKTKLVSWIHVEQHTMARLAASFRSAKEARKCYDRFDKTVCVSKYVKDDFCNILNFQKQCDVIYNTVESEHIREQAKVSVEEIADSGKIRLVGVGTLKAPKGFDRLLRVTKRLHESDCPVHLYILGKGPLQSALESQIAHDEMSDYVTLLGYRTNPYAYVSKCDVFVCSSYSEGFSTAATEALIVGTPVCTVDVSGMKEMLGENNEYGIITENNEDRLYKALFDLLTTPEKLSHYKKQAKLRGNKFSTKETVLAAEEILLNL